MEQISKIKINEVDEVVILEEGQGDVESIELTWMDGDEYPLVSITFDDGTERNYLGSHIIWYEKS